MNRLIKICVNKYDCLLAEEKEMKRYELNKLDMAKKLTILY